ncbi:hypothetical protein [Woeseia oceani]|uniref:hypothetical protein n=1 Tax=Woeseia oceani TaxID=1548547 RepID=UPI0012EA5B51|nr:hypothetical protein [Woeseia oceani]
MLVFLAYYRIRNWQRGNAMVYAALVFGLLGVVAYVRLDKLIKTLKEQGVLRPDYKEE